MRVNPIGNYFIIYVPGEPEAESCQLYHERVKRPPGWRAGVLVGVGDRAWAQEMVERLGIPPEDARLGTDEVK